MHFDETFACSRRPQWFSKYIDLPQLTELSGFEISLSLEIPSPFFIKLEEEVNRYTNFYVNTLISLEEMRMRLKEERKDIRRTYYAEDIHVYLESLIKLAHEAMEISLFMHLNLQATRVIIKRYEEHITKHKNRVRFMIRNKLRNINQKVRDILASQVLDKILEDLQLTHYTKCKQLIEQMHQESLLGASLEDKLEVLGLAIDDLKTQLYKRTL